MRRRFTRFQPENFKHNFALVEAVKSLAEKKGITPGQLAIAWVASLGPHVIPLPGSSYVLQFALSSADDSMSTMTQKQEAQLGEYCGRRD